ncbi:MAG: Fe-S cluster assembly sulfur transfer protein SufU [Deinococcales bacterium]
MSLLEQMYKDILVSHQQRPRNRGRLEVRTHTAHGHNPSCGDQLDIDLRIEGETILELRFIGQGCAISQASASLMTTALIGKSVAEARAIAADFSAMLRSGQNNDTLGELNALVGVSKLYTRVKCAMLAWQTLEIALNSSEVSPTADQSLA